MESGTFALLVLLGAIVGLDFVSFPQAMLSRPIVAATLGAAVCGHAGDGLLVGVLVECFALETMPFGASRYPEWGPASLVAGAVAAVNGGDPGAAARMVPFAVLAALGGATLGGRSLVWLRHVNLSVAVRKRDAIAAGDASAILSLQRTGLAVDFLRGGVLTVAFLLVLVPARNAVLAATRVGPGTLAVAVAGTIAVGVAGGAIWKVVHGTKGYAWWLLAGMLAGGAIVVLK
jgi:mannose/fructose/N-acetylgalactosamine-specific phosphotransferase system component IIC